MRRKIFSRFPSLLPTHLSRKFFILRMGTQASPASDYTARTLAEGTHCLVNAL